MATINMLEETANYLLNHCFVLGGVEDQRSKYLYVQDHLDEVRAVFAPLGYSVLLYPAPLQAAALVNGHEGSQARLLKYESILLLVLRLLYLQKRESLAANADQVLVTVEEVQTELQKMNLPRRLDQKTLENLMRTLRRYNLARPVGRLTGLDSRIEVFPTVLLALPDADLADAAAESGRTRTELGLYERPDEAGAIHLQNNSMEVLMYLSVPIGCKPIQNLRLKSPPNQLSVVRLMHHLLILVHHLYKNSTLQ